MELGSKLLQLIYYFAPQNSTVEIDFMVQVLFKILFFSLQLIKHLFHRRYCNFSALPIRAKHAVKLLFYHSIQSSGTHGNFSLFLLLISSLCLPAKYDSG